MMLDFRAHAQCGRDFDSQLDSSKNHGSKVIKKNEKNKCDSHCWKTKIRIYKRDDDLWRDYEDVGCCYTRMP